MYTKANLDTSLSNLWICARCLNTECTEDLDSVTYLANHAWHATHGGDLILSQLITVY
jgi:hypothetical protein